MELKDRYNMAYRSFTPDFVNASNLNKIDEIFEENAESLLDFYRKYISQYEMEHETQYKTCLETGCGMGALSSFLAKDFTGYLGVDFSELAVANASLISSLKNNNAQFKVLDVTNKQMLNEKFDFIIDGHLLHCLTSKEERKNYFEFIKNHLRDDGIFLCETMAFHKKLQFPIDYEFDEDFILYQQGEDGRLPYRSILPSRALEEEILESGLKIKTLFFHQELSFYPFREQYRMNTDHLPRVIRLSLGL